MDELNFTFSMPDDEILAKYISIKGEKGDGPGATKTSELVNDSDFTTNAALNSGLATKADKTTVQSLQSQVNSNTEAIEELSQIGEITFTRSYQSTTGRWYKLTTLAKNNDNDHSDSINIRGRFSDTNITASSQIDITLGTRMANGINAVGDLYTNVSADIAFRNGDIVVYQEADLTYSVYLKLGGGTYWCDVELQTIVHDCQFEYDGTYTSTEPNGTLVWSLSTASEIQKTINGSLNANITGTVNGFTISSNVPHGAKFTDTIYDDSQIVAELDTKANSSEVATTYATKAEVNAEISDLDTRIDSIASGSPIPVSSVSQMTDTTKTYVNTTDGKWYYYNGSAWVIGGTYQASQIAPNSVEKYMTKFRKPSGKNLFDWSSASVLSLNTINSPITANDNTKVIYIPVEHYKRYTVSKISSARFRLSLYNAVPAVGVSQVGNAVHDNTATSLTIDVSNNASYLAVFYYLVGTDTLTEEEVRKSITICESNYEEYPSSVPYYALSVGKDDINMESVTPSRTTFAKETANIFDEENITILNAFFNTTTTYLCANNNMRTIAVPCKPNTFYTVNKPSLSQRFAIGYTKEIPLINSTVYGVQHEDTQHSLSLTTGSDATHIVVFLCNTTIMSFEEAIEGLMVYEGVAPDYYVPHKVIAVNTENIADGSVTRAKLADGIMSDNPLSSRSKVYGIQFDITDDDPVCTRIGDAAGLKNDYLVGNEYQLNNGVNDFDNIFPWCEMRRCNLNFANGKKVVTYEGETGFSLNGSNGNVMVEIPKFYSRRERVANNEYWAITGEPKSGFAVEPAFVVNGVEQDHIYVGAYNSTTDSSLGGVFSFSGKLPTVNKSLQNFVNEYSNYDLQSYDLSIFLMMQKLMTIEFGTRNIQTYLGGIVNQSYMRQTAALNPDGVIKEVVGANEIKIESDSTERSKYYFAGMYIKFGQQGQGSDTNITNNVRKIVSITEDSQTGYLDIVYDGADMSSTIAADTWGVYGMAQENGLTDGLTYHTGRTDFATVGTNSVKKTLNNPFRYRGIENVWGNVWERICGIKLRNLRYFYSFTPNNMTTISEVNDWHELDYDVPLQTTAGHAATAWIVEQHYDRNEPLLNLPEVVGSTNGGGDNKFFSDSFYSNNTADRVYESVVGGAWDHYIYAGLFTIRSYIAEGNDEWLYGNRPIYRG